MKLKYNLICIASIFIFVNSAFAGGAKESSEDFLSGPPKANAVDYVKDYHAPLKSQDFETYRDGIVTYKTQVLALIGSKATVAQVNSTLKKFHASIAGSMYKSPTLVLLVPDQGSYEGLRKICHEIQKDGAFSAVTPQNIPQPI
jgi:hypothetical protein